MAHLSQPQEQGTRASAAYAGPRLRIGTVCGDPVRVEGFVSLLHSLADLVPMTPTDAVRDSALTMVLIDATAQLLDIMAAYRRARPALRLLVFGESNDPSFIGRVVAAGAKGYLSHTASPEEIITAVTIIADGSIWAPRKVLASLIDTYSPGQFSIPAASPRFTPRERQVLELLVTGQADREIAASLEISPRTVHSVVGRLLRKTGVHNRVALTVRAIDRFLFQ